MAHLRDLTLRSPQLPVCIPKPLLVVVVAVVEEEEEEEEVMVELLNQRPSAARPTLLGIFNSNKQYIYSPGKHYRGGRRREEEGGGGRRRVEEGGRRKEEEGGRRRAEEGGRRREEEGDFFRDLKRYARLHTRDCPYIFWRGGGGEVS